MRHFTTSRQRRLAGIAGSLALALSLAACGAATQVRYHGYVVSDAMLAQVPVGASEEQVQLALGSPSTTSTVPETGKTYYYISQRTEAPAAFMPPRVVDQRVVAVYFDNSDRVRQVANYGLEDGRVFDFVTRTTPTGGRDVSFVGQLLQNVGRPTLPGISN